MAQAESDVAKMLDKRQRGLRRERRHEAKVRHVWPTDIQPLHGVTSLAKSERKTA